MLQVMLTAPFQLIKYLVPGISRLRTDMLVCNLLQQVSYINREFIRGIKTARAI